MDWYMTILRFIHVLFAIVWVGGTAFMVLFAQPALRRISPEIAGPAMMAFGPRAVNGLMFSAAVVFIVGVLMVLRVLGLSGLGDLFTTSWGISITVGFLLATAMLILGLRFTALNMYRMKAMMEAGTPPEPAEAMRMQSQMRYGAMGALAFGILAVGAMVLARGYNP